MGNGQPSTPNSSVALESELFINRVFSASRWTNIWKSSVAWTTSGEINSCPSGPNIAWMAFVSLFMGGGHQSMHGLVR